MPATPPPATRTRSGAGRGFVVMPRLSSRRPPVASGAATPPRPWKPAIESAGVDAGSLDAARLRRLIDAGRSLVSQFDLDELLERLIEVAASITGARYAALGILDDERRELERFLTHGIDAEGRRAIGDLPRGRGILGVLIEDPRTLRLSSVGDDARSYGFPPGHPPMATFLGTPVLIRGEAWGNLYLTEKEGGAAFSAADEDAA